MDFLYDEKGTPFAFEYQGKMYFYQTNLQGDIIGIVDSKGSQVVVYRYDAWGEVLVSSDASGFGLSQINQRDTEATITIRRQDCIICRQDTTTRR